MTHKKKSVAKKVWRLAPSDSVSENDEKGDAKQKVWQKRCGGSPPPIALLKTMEKGDANKGVAKKVWWLVPSDSVSENDEKGDATN